MSGRNCVGRSAVEFAVQGRSGPLASAIAGSSHTVRPYSAYAGCNAMQLPGIGYPVFFPP
jgi:hypothetical protein